MKCLQEDCANWSGDGNVCPCALFDLEPVNVTDQYANEAAANYEKMLDLDRPIEERLKDFERIRANSPVIKRK